MLNSSRCVRAPFLQQQRGGTISRRKKTKIKYRTRRAGPAAGVTPSPWAQSRAAPPGAAAPHAPPSPPTRCPALITGLIGSLITSREPPHGVTRTPKPHSGFPRPPPGPGPPLPRCLRAAGAVIAAGAARGAAKPPRAGAGGRGLAPANGGRAGERPRSPRPAALRAPACRALPRALRAAGLGARGTLGVVVRAARVAPCEAREVVEGDEGPGLVPRCFTPLALVGCRSLQAAPHTGAGLWPDGSPFSVLHLPKKLRSSVVKLSHFLMKENKK